MVEEKTYVCPNCGAKTTNTENCDHCGSLLVRFVEKGIDVNSTPYTDDSLVLPGLIKELETNLKLQEKYRGRNVDTEISWLDNNGDEEWLFICNYLDDVEDVDDNSDNTISENPHLIIYFKLIYDNEIKDGESALYNNKKKDALLMRFTQLMAYPLFIFHDHERYEDDDFYTKDFYLNCGQDFKSAARIASELLIKVKGLSSSTNYKIVTSYRDENDDDVEVYTYHSKSQEISDTDNTSNQNNQAKVIDKTVGLKEVNEEKINMIKYVCSVCGYTHDGSVPPEKCPVCLSSASEFSEIQEEMVVEETIEEAKDESIDSDSFTNPRLNDDVINEENTTHEEYKSIKEEEKPCEVLNKQMDSRLAPDEEEIIGQYNRTHDNNEVIKWYMNTYNVGLKEAIDRVDEVLIKHNLWNRGKIGGGCVITILVAITSTLSLFWFL